jgi:ankyrin repeat protein
VKIGNVAQAESALLSGEDPNAVDEAGYSCLHWACQEGNVAVVDLLIRWHADVNLPDNEGYRPLEVAINRGHPVAAAAVLSASLDQTKSRNGFSYLHACAAASDSATLELLLKFPASLRLINTRDEGGSGFTALHWAAQSGDKKTLELLLRSGADPNLIDANGFAPLHIAAGENHLHLLDLLIKEGVNIDLRCSAWNGGTCLHYACIWEETDLLQKLLKAGADKTLADDHGKTPLDYCRETGNPDLEAIVDASGYK